MANKIFCAYCGGTMHIVTNLRTSEARSYFLCDACGARSPRARRRFAEGKPANTVPTDEMISKAVAAAEKLAFSLAEKTRYDFDFSDDNIRNLLKID